MLKLKTYYYQNVYQWGRIIEGYFIKFDKNLFNYMLHISIMNISFWSRTQWVYFCSFSCKQMLVHKIIKQSTSCCTIWINLLPNKCELKWQPKGHFVPFSNNSRDVSSKTFNFKFSVNFFYKCSFKYIFFNNTFVFAHSILKHTLYLLG